MLNNNNAVTTLGAADMLGRLPPVKKVRFMNV